jgi:hypothetical protein
MNSRTLLASAALLALVAAQNNTAVKVPAYYNKFLGCVQANSHYSYCNDGNCYNTQGNNSVTLVIPAGLTCSSDFNANYSNPIFPSTYSLVHNIDKLDIETLPIGANSATWLSLKQGESLRLKLKSVTDKSAYIDLLYNTVVASGSDNIVKENNTMVQFLVFNDRLKEVRKFDVSKVDKVLLPQSADTFTVYLAARGADFNITVLASSSVVGRAFAMIAAVFAIFALSF